MMEIKEKIEKQIEANFSHKEIYDSLLAEGYSKQEIEAELTIFAHEIKQESKSNTKGILLGCVFLVIVVYRIFRFSNSRSGAAAVFAFIGILTAGLLAILYFSRKNRG